MIITIASDILNTVYEYILYLHAYKARLNNLQDRMWIGNIWSILEE